MPKISIPLILFAVCFHFPLSAQAQPRIVIEMVSEIEIVELVGGSEVIKTIPAKEVEPGQTLIFTLNYTNKGDEKATNVMIKNPIPKDTVYVVGSATGNTPMFSIDGGNLFKNPSLLTYETAGPGGRPVTKIASPEQYTDIRWTIPEVLAGAAGQVSFRTKVN